MLVEKRGVKCAPLCRTRIIFMHIITRIVSEILDFDFWKNNILLDLNFPVHQIVCRAKILYLWCLSTSYVCGFAYWKLKQWILKTILANRKLKCVQLVSQWTVCLNNFLIYSCLATVFVRSFWQLTYQKQNLQSSVNFPSIWL